MLLLLLLLLLFTNKSLLLNVLSWRRRLMLNIFALPYRRLLSCLPNEKKKRKSLSLRKFVNQKFSKTIESVTRTRKIRELSTNSRAQRATTIKYIMDDHNGNVFSTASRRAQTND